MTRSRNSSRAGSHVRRGVSLVHSGGSPVRRGASPVRRGASPVRGGGGDDDSSRSPSPSIPRRKSRGSMQTPSATAKSDSSPLSGCDSIRFTCCFTWGFA